MRVAFCPSDTGSNSARVVDECRVFCVALCAGTGPLMGRSPILGVLLCNVGFTVLELVGWKNPRAFIMCKR